MGWLNNLFSSTEGLAKGMAQKDELILKAWQEYIETLPKKAAIISKLSPWKNFKSNLEQLKALLKIELVDISGEERKEAEIIADLEALEHNKKIKRVQKLEQCLGYAETKYKYINELLSHIYSALKAENHLVDKLLTGAKNPEELITHLKHQLEIEEEAVRQIQARKTFHQLFLDLVKGEHIVQQMDAKEKKLAKKMQKGLGSIFSNETNEGVTYEWTRQVFNAIEDKIHEAVANDIFKGYHENIDFEFVNRPEFESLVREVIASIRKRQVSEQMINAFVHMFREWYNHERS